MKTWLVSVALVGALSACGENAGGTSKAIGDAVEAAGTVAAASAAAAGAPELAVNIARANGTFRLARQLASVGCGVVLDNAGTEGDVIDQAIDPVAEFCLGREALAAPLAAPAPAPRPEGG